MYLHLLYVLKTSKCKYVWRKKIFLRLGVINYSQEKDLNNLVATRKHQKNPEKEIEFIFNIFFFIDRWEKRCQSCYHWRGEQSRLCQDIQSKKCSDKKEAIDRPSERSFTSKERWYSSIILRVIKGRFNVHVCNVSISVIKGRFSNVSGTTQLDLQWGI